MSKKEITTDKKAFDNFELQILREAFKRNYLIYEYIAIAMYSGLRIQEITLLKKENIDLENRLIKIDREMTKTASGQRIIPIHRNIYNILEHNLYESLEQNIEYVISKNGNVNAITKKINREINKINKDKSKTFHSLRKNFSQQLYLQQQLKNNIDDKTIKALLGHSQNDMTFEVYNKNRVALEVLKNAIDSIDYDQASF